MEFEHVGKHCQHPGCNVKDFLPFLCDRCDMTTCLEHRSYTSHQCKNAAKADWKVFKCPLCAGGVRIVPDEDINLTFTRHTKTECDPSKRERRVKKKRCPAPKCRTKLVFSNTAVCDACKQEVCLTHRFEASHACPGRASAARSGFLSGLAARMTGSGSAGSRVNKPKPAAAAAAAAAPSPAAASRRPVVRPPTIPASSAAAAAAAPTPAGGRSTREICPTCRAQFPSVEDLIAHCEWAHSGSSDAAAASASAVAAVMPGSAPAPIATPASAPAPSHAPAPARSAPSPRVSAGADGSCPYCRFQTTDPVVLVEHVSALHADKTSSSNKSCLVC